MMVKFAQSAHKIFLEEALHRLVVDLLNTEISQLNRELASYETVKKFRILEEELDQDKDEVTPTLKVKRKVVINNYQDLINKMYS